MTLFYTLSFQSLSKRSTHPEYQKDIQSKVGLAGHRKTHHPDVQTKNLTDSSFVVK